MAEPSSPFTSTALLALNAEGQQIVSIHHKVTYAFSADGRCRPADEQQPLLIPDPNSDKEPIRETDVTPVKTGTDLIVLASAHAPKSGTREMIAKIGIAGAAWEYAICGERTAGRNAVGEIVFSKPEPFETIPMRYERAYGGFDESVPEKPIQNLLDAFSLHPGVYPRNPVGRGYFVSDASPVDGLPLPNVEHPRQRITPTTLIAGGPQNWWKQPIPWSCDWFDKTWYPRLTYFGALPEHLPDDDSRVTEVRMGFVAARQNARHARLTNENRLDSRFTNAASPALVLPLLRGDEAVLFEGMTPEQRLLVQLPSIRPRMFVRFEGRAHEITPVVHRVLISTEEMGSYIVWHGAWSPPRSLPDRLPREGDTASMELEGVEVFVDGKVVEPLV